MKINSAKILSILAVLMLAVAPAIASTNVISSIVISKSKEKPNSYELNIDSTQSSQYKTNVEEDGSVYFDLKNATLAQNALPVYDDVADIENVSLKQLEKNKVRIYVKGKNAKNTEVIFINSVFEPQAQKKIIINRPINQYKPTNFEDDLDDSVQDWDDNSFNLSHLVLSIINNFKDGAGSILCLVLFLFAAFVIAFKKIATKITSDQEPLIGIDSRILNSNNPISREEALKSVQNELTKAHQKYQTYIQNKYNGSTTKPKTVEVDALKRSTALNQYQKSNKNPYLDQEVLRIKKEFPTNVINTQIPPKTQALNEKMPVFKSPYIQRKDTKLDNNDVKNETMTKPYQKQDNLKFLESVTKIYEQSGRDDLASGLKNSMTKAKQTL